MDDLIVAGIVEEPRRPWGLWATVGLSLAAFSTLVAVQTVVVIVFAVEAAFAQTPSGSMELDAATIEASVTTGWLMSVATCVSWPVCLGLVALFAWLRRPWTVTDYLALAPVSWRQAAVWTLLTVLLAAATDGLTWLLGRPIVSEFMIRTYQSAGWLPLLWVTLIVVAPVGEKLFFRGFLFRGLQASRLGQGGTILITSAAWAAIHLQYDAFQIGICFACGLLLGAARVRTGSTTVPIALHALNNLIATVEAHLATG